jgi:hypothetical protein
MKKDKNSIVSQKPYNENGYVKPGTYNFEIVKDYTYLGTILTNKNELRPETAKELRIPIERTYSYYALLPLIKNQSVHSEHKQQ